MATSGSKSISVTSWDTLKFSWEIKSQSVANNTSTISWKMELIAGSSGRISSTAAKSWSVTVNGTKYSGSNTVGIGNNETKTLASGTTTIAHNADGTKSFSFSFSQQFSITFSGATIGTKSGSGSGTLTTIPRKSSLTVSNGTLGTALTLAVTKQASSFTHTITYKCGTASGTIAEKSSSTSISWTPPLTLAQQNKTGTTVSITFTITTYNGSTSVGSSTKTISCSIPASVKPSVSIAVSDDMGFADTYGGYIKGRSKIKVVVTAAGAQGSTIKAYKTTANGKSYTAAEVVTDVVASTGTLTISTTVTDSRGRTATASKTITALAYSVPKVTALTAKRTTADGTSSTTGGHLTVTFTAAIYALSNKNTAAYILKYKKSSEAVYTSVTLSAYAGQYSVTDGKHTFAADGGSTYDIILAAVDAFGEADRATVGASESPFFSVLAGWLGIAFGKTAEHEGVFDIGFQTLFSGGVKGVPLADGTDLDTVMIPNTYIGRSPAAAGYLNCPISTGTTFTLEVLEAGHDGQIMQRLTACSNANLVVYHRFWYSGQWGTDWITQEGTGSAESGYTVLSYIQGTGAQYIDTGVTAKSTLVIHLDFVVDEPVMYCIIGYYKDDSDCFRLFNHSNGCYLDFGKATNRISGGTMSAGTRYSVQVGNRYVKNKSTNANIVSGSAVAAFTGTDNVYIFGNSNHPAGKIYSCQIFDGDTLLRDFVPVRNAAGVCGLYDRANVKFYANAGTGAFTGA